MEDSQEQSREQSAGEHFEEKCSTLRFGIRERAELVKILMDHDVFEEKENPQADFGEMKANIMLAYRHLEDARMRLGKAIQAYDGGVSVYDK